MSLKYDNIDIDDMSALNECLNIYSFWNFWFLIKDKLKQVQHNISRFANSKRLIYLKYTFYPHISNVDYTQHFVIFPWNEQTEARWYETNKQTNKQTKTKQNKKQPDFRHL